MFPVTNRQQPTAYAGRIQSRDTNTESIKRLALSILATAATYFLCPRPVFLITTGISLMINLPLAQTMSSELFRVFQHIVVFLLQRQQRVDVPIHNSGSGARSPRSGESTRDRPEPRPETVPATYNGTVGQRAVTSTCGPLAPQPVDTSEQWAAPLRTEHTPRQAPEALHVTRGRAWGGVTRARGPASDFERRSSPQRASSAAGQQPPSTPLQGAVGARTPVRSHVPTTPPTLGRQFWRDEEEEKENRDPFTPHHGIVGIGQRRGL